MDRNAEVFRTSSRLYVSDEHSKTTQCINYELPVSNEDVITKIFPKDEDGGKYQMGDACCLHAPVTAIGRTSGLCPNYSVCIQLRLRSIWFSNTAL